MMMATTTGRRRICSKYNGKKYYNNPLKYNLLTILLVKVIIIIGFIRFLYNNNNNNNNNRNSFSISIPYHFDAFLITNPSSPVSSSSSAAAASSPSSIVSVINPSLLSMTNLITGRRIYTTTITRKNSNHRLKLSPQLQQQQQQQSKVIRNKNFVNNKRGKGKGRIMVSSSSEEEGIIDDVIDSSSFSSKSSPTIPASPWDNYLNDNDNGDDGITLSTATNTAEFVDESKQQQDQDQDQDADADADADADGENNDNDNSTTTTDSEEEIDTTQFSKEYLINNTPDVKKENIDMNAIDPIEKEFHERANVIKARKALKEKIISFCGMKKANEILSKMVIMDFDHLQSNQEITKEEFIIQRQKEKLHENLHIEELMKMPSSIMKKGRNKNKNIMMMMEGEEGFQTKLHKRATKVNEMEENILKKIKAMSSDSFYAAFNSFLSKMAKNEVGIKILHALLNENSSKNNDNVLEGIDTIIGENLPDTIIESFMNILPQILHGDIGTLFCELISLQDKKDRDKNKNKKATAAADGSKSLETDNNNDDVEKDDDEIYKIQLFQNMLLDKIRKKKIVV